MPRPKPSTTSTAAPVTTTTAATTTTKTTTAKPTRPYIPKREPPMPTAATLIDDNSSSHKGVAMPMTLEEIEREMAAVDIKLKESSTSKEGISTWILLSGSQPTAQPSDFKGPTYRIESDQKIDKIARIQDQQKQKKPVTPKVKQGTTAAPVAQDDEEDLNDDEEYEEEEEEVQAPPPSKKPQQTQVNKPKPNNEKRTTTTKRPASRKPQQQPTKAATVKQDEDQLEVTTKKMRRTTTSTTTTEQPELADQQDKEDEEEVTQKPTKLETTTFLILEPKESDFDLPQDRSPGPTKKPKRPNGNKNKKNQKKKQNLKLDDVDMSSDVATKPAKSKKPGSVQKPKPGGTGIYNYLAREVMSTVGVGIFGLVVTAGIASYFLGPFGALRRSYDIAERKDDLYHYNNEEYAGSDGQHEEDMFGKVIAGMPTNSLYRNNVRPAAPQSYRPNQVYQQQQPQTPYSPYGKYSPYNRYRNVPYRPQVYQHQQVGGLGGGVGVAAAPSPIQQQQQASPLQHQTYQQYRYNSQIPETQLKTVSTSTMVQDPSSYLPQQQQQQSNPSSVIVEQIKSTGYEVDSMDNQLQHRTQFVVGSILPETAPDTTAPATEESEQQQQQQEQQQQQQVDETTDAVPEHGPRRRKRAAISGESSGKDDQITKKSLNDNEIIDDDDRNNLIDYDIKVQSSSTTTTIMETPTTTEAPKDVNNLISSESSEDDSSVTTTTTTIKPEVTDPLPNNGVFNMFRRVIELKVRLGLDFLKTATKSFQRYLGRVEERVNSSPLFMKKL